MSADKRSTHTDALATLGTIIQGGGRDAIHLAVEPVIAGEKIWPGQDIGLKNGKAYNQASKHGIKYVGIADPFLKEAINPDQKFWLIVYPRTITSLRHVWEHPDFKAETTNDISGQESSKKWMMEWAKEHMSYDYYGNDETLSDEQAFNNAINAGKECHIGPYESARDFIDNEWWSHWETITGLKGQRGEYFSCSC